VTKKKHWSAVSARMVACLWDRLCSLPDEKRGRKQEKKREEEYVGGKPLASFMRLFPRNYGVIVKRGPRKPKNKTGGGGGGVSTAEGKIRKIDSY